MVATSLNSTPRLRGFQAAMSHMTSMIAWPEEENSRESSVQICRICNFCDSSASKLHLSGAQNSVTFKTLRISHSARLQRILFLWARPILGFLSAFDLLSSSHAKEYLTTDLRNFTVTPTKRFPLFCFPLNS